MRRQDTIIAKEGYILIDTGLREFELPIVAIKDGDTDYITGRLTSWEFYQNARNTNDEVNDVEVFTSTDNIQYVIWIDYTKCKYYITKIKYEPMKIKYMFEFEVELPGDLSSEEVGEVINRFKIVTAEGKNMKPEDIKHQWFNSSEEWYKHAEFVINTNNGIE